MKKILDDIVLNKRLEIEIRRNVYPIKDFEFSPFFYRTPLSLNASVLEPGKSGIIAEFKRRSPSKGIINDKADVVEVTKAYSDSGASGISVLTDHDYFGGADEDLKAVATNRTSPLLRKEFILDPYQVLEARAIGADAILLIAAILSKKEIHDLGKLARSLGMEVLLELHAEDELEKISPDDSLFGINNRNLQSFEVSLEHSMRLADKLPAHCTKIAESGIDSPETALQLKKEGFHGFLIGEYFMRQQNPGEAFKNFALQLNLLNN
ncbi:MAG: indole-3-glycerol phosphate synthase TrpC [Bacteroidia bacterium]|nr:indole-3-glycerol phosphate synthase TrpC [Bacteroidia bacterium]MCC6769337.1 indole-3-glycerol phosphate synthase TrpC [Bacteroidia bacterium]